MFGHHFVVHLNSQLGKSGKVNSIANSVDGQGVPVPNFGVVMNFNDWEVFAQKASQSIDEFIIESQVRFKGEVGEQGTMFFSDASGNALEFKGFKNIENIDKILAERYEQKLEDIQKWLKITAWNDGKPITKNLITRMQNKMVRFSVIEKSKDSGKFI